ncbi:MAG: class I SAM-dependent methyltransferase [Steroidobacteraceae bacterium]
MDEFTASRTALATSLMRAVHTRLDPNPLIDDPWGDRLVPAAVREMIRTTALSRMDSAARLKAMAAPDGIVDASLRRSPAYANVITRTRYTEDALKAAVGAGVRQYVLIGAGFDSFILRSPPYAADLEIFEIDHPATQGLKIQRIKELGIALPGSVHFIAADLSVESVASALSRSSFRNDLASFISWLGVSMYLSRAANLATLRSIAQCALPGSELVLTYIDERLLGSQSDNFLALQERLASLGEPFLSGFDPKIFGETLRECGLELREDLSGEEIARKYGRTDSMSSGHSSFSHIARARVLEREDSRAEP